MIIYQLHEYSGQYEDFRDRIIGSYLKRKRAEEEKAKVELKEKELIELSKKCANCPFWNGEFSNLNILISNYPDYCKEPKLEECEDDEIYCGNHYVHWDDTSFEIKEVEVEEE